MKKEEVVNGLKVLAARGESMVDVVLPAAAKSPATLAIVFAWSAGCVALGAWLF